MEIISGMYDEMLIGECMAGKYKQDHIATNRSIILNLLFINNRAT